MMRTIYIEKYPYKGDLATVETDIEFVLSEEDFIKYNNGISLDQLETRISAHWVETLERRAAFEYFRKHYTKAFEGQYHPEAWEIRCIIALWNISRTQAASCLGIDKATLSNQKKNRAHRTRFCMNPIGVFKSLAS